MKQLFLALATILPVLASAQSKPSRSFLDCIDLPTEFGVALSPSGAAQPGVYFRMSIEYRPQITEGWFISAELGDFDQKFSNFAVEGMNVSAGTEVNTTLLAGAGYRFPLVPEKFSLSVVVHGGVALACLQNVASEQTSLGIYALEDKNFTSPAGKMTIEAEYYASKHIAILASAGYYHYFSPRPLEPRGIGTLVLTVGFATFF